ncbi:MAG: hypothetical protein Q4F05_05025 [bacterium]|nr:hypothetical protein [bacterium]
MDYKCKETIITNMKDFGCDDLTINAFIKCFEQCDRDGQKKILDRYREKLLVDLHQNQKNIDLLDYMVYQLEKCNCK